MLKAAMTQSSPAAKAVPEYRHRLVGKLPNSTTAFPGPPLHEPGDLFRDES